MISLRFGKDYKLLKEFTKLFCFTKQPQLTYMMLAGWCCLQLLLDLLYCCCTTTTQSLSGGWVASYQLSGSLPTWVEVELGCDNKYLTWNINGQLKTTSWVLELRQRHSSLHNLLLLLFIRFDTVLKFASVQKCFTKCFT